MTAQNRRFAIMLAGVIGILLLPLLARPFTREVNWTLFDFLVVGTPWAGS